MAQLARTRVGAFGIDTAIPLSKVEQLRDSGELMDVIKSPEYIFRDLDALHVKNSVRLLLENGNSFRKDNLVDENPSGLNDTQFDDEMFKEGNAFRVYGEDETFFGIYTYSEKTKVFNVDKFFFEKN
jgi:tRNA pseudouridine55 synthase